MDLIKKSWSWVLAAVIAVVLTHSWDTLPTYVGKISSVNVLTSGVVFDLDGKYPDEKMIAFIPTSMRSIIGDKLPPEGTVMYLYGPKTKYKGHNEIVLSMPAQFSLSTAAKP